MAFRRRAVEGLVEVQREFSDVFSGTRVFITGHTGFKGAWLSRWLLDLGAELTGYALEPETVPALFTDLGLGAAMESHIGDVRDQERLTALVAQAKPDVVLHLAAQPLVRRSYAEPRYTFEVNMLGTVNVLEAVRASSSCGAFVNVTTDKVYANPETGHPFDEDQPLGGRDPYSASKAGSEIVTASYRDSYFAGPDAAAVATARAGNVIGGGDWAEDRLVPDCARALSAGQPVFVRNPHSIRPWQHVLEPLSGYLHLAASLLNNRSLAGPYNFGPDPLAARTVGEVADHFVSAWGEGSWESPDLGAQPHEAAQLQLDIGKAERVLGWRPVWTFDDTIQRTAAWYHAYTGGEDATALVEADFDAYLSAARHAAAPWA